MDLAQHMGLCIGCFGMQHNQGIHDFQSSQPQWLQREVAELLRQRVRHELSMHKIKLGDKIAKGKHVSKYHFIFTQTDFSKGKKNHNLNFCTEEEKKITTQ